VLGALPIPIDPNVLVGFGTRDDAAIYKLTDELALALTIDVFTPVVDDPYAFGAVAAANALSDVYAMGARPVAMLSFAGFPRGTLPWDVLERMLKGGADKAREAGVDVVGGHTVDDPEPKCGYAVVGVVHPERAVSNAGGQPGDRLVLTKPLGSGVLTTAIKRDLLDQDGIQRVVDVMATLNRAAAEAMLQVGVHACTDVTGFGLLGHLYEMASASGLSAIVRLEAVPILPGVLELIEQGVVPGGTRTNEAYLEEFTTWGEGVNPHLRVALADAQTSGGLLIALSAERTDELVAALGAAGTHSAAVIGELVAGEPGTLRVELS
jgi:selenide, water dikinase